MQGRKMTGVQSMLLSFFGGMEGLQRTVKELLGGADPVQIFAELQTAFNSMGEAIRAQTEKLDQLGRELAAGDARITASHELLGADLTLLAASLAVIEQRLIGLDRRLSGDTGAGTGDGLAAALAAQSLADVGSGPARPIAFNGAGIAHADTGDAQHQSGSDGVADRGAV